MNGQWFFIVTVKNSFKTKYMVLILIFNIYLYSFISCCFICRILIQNLDYPKSIKKRLIHHVKWSKNYVEQERLFLCKFLHSGELHVEPIFNKMVITYATETNNCATQVIQHFWDQYTVMEGHRTITRH